MPISPPSRLCAGVIAALAVAAFGASASSALAYQRLDINDTTVQEGSHGVGGTATFTITDHYDFGEAPSYDYQVQTTSVTAGAGDDYVETTDSGGFTGLVPCGNQAGCTHESTFSVPIVGDDVPEDNETFEVYLSSSLPVGNAIARATIFNDDAPAPSIPGTPSGPAAPSAPAGPSQGGSTSGPVSTAGGPATDPGQTQVDDLAPDFSREFLGMRKSVRVRISCPADEISCHGRLFVRPDLTRNYGVLPFNLRGGESRTVSVPLSRAKRLKLRRAGTFFLRAVAYDAAGNRTVRDAWEGL